MEEEIELLIKKREEARRNKDWSTADSIREQLKKMGIILEDTPEEYDGRKRSYEISETISGKFLDHHDYKGKQRLKLK